MDPEQMESLSETDRKMAGMTNESENKKEGDPFVDEKGVEQPFSKEGLLNRNFGMDVKKPSSTLFYRDGILNRAMFHENFNKVYDRIMNKETNPPANQETPAMEQITEVTNQESPIENQNPDAPENVESQAVDKAMTDLFDVFKDDKDPEGAAFQYIKTHLDSNLSLEKQLDKIREFKQEYLKYKDQLKS
jgi:hypothetical protein